jgi:hypothetical protein
MKKPIITIKLNKQQENNTPKNNLVTSARHKRDSLIHCFQKQAGV